MIKIEMLYLLLYYINRIKIADFVILFYCIINYDNIILCNYLLASPFKSMGNCDQLLGGGARTFIKSWINL